MTQTQHDIIAELLNDHQQVKQMFSRMEQVAPGQAREMFWELTNELVRHEVAEEEILYPEVRKALPQGDQLADERINEQSEAEELLAQIEKAGRTIRRSWRSSRSFAGKSWLMPRTRRPSFSPRSEVRSTRIGASRWAAATRRRRRRPLLTPIPTRPIPRPATWRSVPSPP